MSKRKHVVALKVNDRDFYFQKLISFKNETYKLLDIIRKEIQADYSSENWFTKSLNEIDEAKESIICVLSEPNITIKNHGVWRTFTELSEKNKKQTSNIFADYVDGYISGPTESQLIDLCDNHHELNNLIRVFIGSIDYDRASHGE
jgi:hypothetical protein